MVFDLEQRIKLQQLIQNSKNYVDQTELIRSLKHSVIIRDNILDIVRMKRQGSSVVDIQSKCTFLFTYYTDLFHKVYNDEINMRIMFEFLDVLRRIETGELHQEEGSFLIGSKLKELYVDSAEKRADKLAENNISVVEYVEPLKVSYADFKNSLA
jgi:hypothetical protein